MDNGTKVMTMCKSLEEVINSVMSFIDKDLEDGNYEIPTVTDVSNVNRLYDGYKYTVVKYQEVSNKIALLIQVQVKLKQLRRSIRDDSTFQSYKYRSVVISQIEYLLNQIDSIRESVFALKSKYEKTLQFYNSSQYIISTSTYKV